MKKKILVVLGHPRLKDSHANLKIIEELKTKLLPDVHIEKLAELYPDYVFDVVGEQKKILDHDIIVFQFPFYWYNAPALLRKWTEDVICYGFGFDEKGGKLIGKKLVISFTMGDVETNYVRGEHTFELAAYVDSFRKMCELTGMTYVGHIFSDGYEHISDDQSELVKKCHEKSVDHAKRLAELLEKL